MLKRMVKMIEINRIIKKYNQILRTFRWPERQKGKQMILSCRTLIVAKFKVPKTVMSPAATRISNPNTLPERQRNRPCTRLVKDDNKLG